MLTASGGADPLLTDGRMRGGGRFNFSSISEAECNKQAKLFCVELVKEARYRQ